MLHHRPVEHDRHAPFGVVDGAERRDCAGLDAKRGAQQIGRSEREAPPGPKPAVERFEVNRRTFERRHQEQRTLLVLEEEVLGVTAGNRSAQRLRLLDREKRRMSHGAMDDAQPVEKREQFGRCCNHGALAGTCRYAEAPHLPRISPQMLQLQSGAAFGITGSRMRV